MDCMNTKTFRKSDWIALEAYAEANTEHAKQRIDESGRVWEWIRGGKRVDAKQIRGWKNDKS